MDEQIKDLATTVGAAIGAAAIAGISTGLRKLRDRLARARRNDFRFDREFHASVRELRRSTAASRVVVLYAHRNGHSEWLSTVIACSVPDEDADPASYWTDRAVTGGYASILEGLLVSDTVALATQELERSIPDLWVIYKALGVVRSEVFRLATSGDCLIYVSLNYRHEDGELPENAMAKDFHLGKLRRACEGVLG